MFAIWYFNNKYINKKKTKNTHWNNVRNDISNSVCMYMRIVRFRNIFVVVFFLSH